MTIIRNIFKRILKQYPRDLYWQIYGSFLMNRKIPAHVKSVHFVCKGNICRSAFAHQLGHRLFGEVEGKNFSVSSSGLEVNQQESSPKDALNVAEKYFNIFLGNHLSTRITTEICEHADLILVMEGWQLSAVQKRFPSSKGKCFLLAQFELESNEKCSGYGKYNIPDPYGKGEQAFVGCFSRIEKCFRGLIKRIIEDIKYEGV